jgi:hypothetical protein
VLRESLRVVKPGGYALVWSLPRTSHWTGWALEEAGWEIRDSVMHVFLQGMPKSLDAGKAIDRLAAVERPVVGKAPWSQPAISGHNAGRGHPSAHDAPEGRFMPDVTSAAPDDAREWDGWGSGLKPAHETWWLARKPSGLNVAENLLTWGIGALNLPASRVYSERGDGVWGSSNEDCVSGFNASPDRQAYRSEATEAADGLVGRWPANVVLSDRVFDGVIDGVPIEGVVGGGTSKGGSYPTQRGVGRSTGFGAGKPTEGGPRQMGGEGGKSRYFVLPKASRRDRDSGVEDARPVQNDHIAVKGLDLMRHLVRLVARKGCLVLDPFAGSGSTGVAAALESMDYLLIEREREYVTIARARLGLDEEGE